MLVKWKEQWRAGVDRPLQEAGMGQGSGRAAEVWAGPWTLRPRFLQDLEAAEIIFTYPAWKLLAWVLQRCCLKLDPFLHERLKALTCSVLTLTSINRRSLTIIWDLSTRTCFYLGLWFNWKWDFWPGWQLKTFPSHFFFFKVMMKSQCKTLIKKKKKPSKQQIN